MKNSHVEKGWGSIVNAAELSLETISVPTLSGSDKELFGATFNMLALVSV
jgi:hypothetical protein